MDSVRFHFLPSLLQWMTGLAETHDFVALVQKACKGRWDYDDKTMKASHCTSHQQLSDQFLKTSTMPGGASAPTVPGPQANQQAF